MAVVEFYNATSPNPTPITAILVSNLCYLALRSACNIALFTDSKFNYINRISSHISLSLETDIINLITKLHISTTITWIPSHVGIMANEQVDKLAKLGTTKPTATTINSNIQLYANHIDIQQEIDQQIEEE
jgi:ribonuclease HI